MLALEVSFRIESTEMLHNFLFQRYGSSASLLGIQNNSSICCIAFRNFKSMKVKLRDRSWWLPVKYVPKRIIDYLVV